MGATPAEMYRLFFGSQDICPDSTEDAGLSCNRPDTQVSNLVPGPSICIIVINLPLKEPSFQTGVDSEGKADQVSVSPSRNQAGSRAGQDAGDNAFGGGGQGSYGLLEGGCSEGRNRQFLS